MKRLAFIFAAFLVLCASSWASPMLTGGGSASVSTAAPASCGNNSYGWSGTQTDTAFTIPANCTLMTGFALGAGAAGLTGTVGQGANGGGSGAITGMVGAASVTGGTTIYVNISASTTCLSSGTGCSGTVYLLANAASGNTAGSTSGAACGTTACTEVAGANGGVSATGSYGGAGGAGAPCAEGTSSPKAGGITTASDYGAGGGGGACGDRATTPAAATTSGHAGGLGFAGTGAGTGGGSSGSHPGHDATANSGGGGQGGYGSNGNNSGNGGAGALYAGLYTTTASATGTVASSTPIDGGGGGGASGGASSGSAIAIGGAGGGCGSGGGGSGGNITSGGSNAGGGAGGPGCVFVSFLTSTGCAPATAFLARVTTSYSTQYTAMICGMVADGTWYDFDVLYILATDSAANALTNLISSSFPASNAGTSTFTANTGYTGDGTATGVLTSTYNYSTSRISYSANSATLLAWGIGLTTNDNSAVIGGASASATNYLTPFVAGVARTWINGSAGLDTTVTSGNYLYAGDRSSSTTITTYQNGSQIGQSTSASSGSVTSETMEGLGFTASGYMASGHGAAMLGVADSLGTTKESAVYSRIHTFLHAVNPMTFP